MNPFDRIQLRSPMKYLASSRSIALALLCVGGLAASAEPAAPVPYPEGAVDEVMPFVHDPVIAVEQDRFFLFHTGPGINAWQSQDMEHWTTLESVFPEIPQWMYETIPGFRGHLWAPDIYHHEGTWYLYYSVSAFGRNTSFIGVATTPTLDPESPDFEWTDHGIVIQSFPGMHNWNAIDANVIDDVDGTPWLAFGSFWGGLQIVKLADSRTALANPDLPEVITIASRNPGPASMPEEGYPVEAGTGAIEAPFIIHRQGYYYLFASTDYCCRGPESTYKMIVGRSKSITGPYVDQHDVPLSEGGGTLLLEGNERWYGVGHNGVTRVEDTDYLVYHGYDAQHEHAWARLLIKPLRWTHGWPAVATESTDCCSH